LGGRDVYLGKYNSPESWEKYGLVIAEWRATGMSPPPARIPGTDTPGPAADEAGPTVNELLLGFWKHAKQHYRRGDGTATNELRNFRDSLRPLRRLYGSTPAGRFTPKMLKAVRQAMIDAGLSRTTINQRIGRVVRVFKWGVAEDLVPSPVHRGLKAVSGLKKGRSEARETQPVQPVPDAFVDAVEPHVSRQVWTMVQIQRLTGMRPGEVTIMRTGDLDTSGRGWVYTPGKHKMEHTGRGRRVPLGPQAREVLKPWLRTYLQAYLFSPGEARAERFAAMRAARKTRVQPSQRDRSKPGAKRRPGLRYTPRTYHHAIAGACVKAGVPNWHPNQLRHNFATMCSKEHGIDVARIILGHANLKTTEIYAEADHAKARAVMERIG
jgi:integrase